jgi:hypothetical protein
MAEIRVQKAGVTGVQAHKASHEPGGDDELTALTAAAFATAYKDGDPGLQTLRSLGTGEFQALPGNHSSTTDARTPTAHKASHAPGGTDALTDLDDSAFAASHIDGVASEPTLRRLGTGAQEAAAGNHLHDTRYIRTVNGTGPDSGGNVTVEGGEGGGAAGVGSIEGVAPNAPGGDVGLASADATVTITPDNALDSVDLSVPDVPIIEASVTAVENDLTALENDLTAHEALTVDPASTDTARTKHVSNNDLNELARNDELESYLPPHQYKGTLAIKTGEGRVPIMRDGTITEIRTAVRTAPTGATLNLTIRINGASVATLAHAAASNAGLWSGLTIEVLAGDYITVDITQIGSTVAGADLTVSYIQRLS